MTAPDSGPLLDSLTRQVEALAKSDAAFHAADLDGLAGLARLAGREPAARLLDFLGQLADLRDALPETDRGDAESDLRAGLRLLSGHLLIESEPGRESKLPSSQLEAFLQQGTERWGNYLAYLSDAPPSGFEADPFAPADPFAVDSLDPLATLSPTAFPSDLDSQPDRQDDAPAVDLNTLLAMLGGSTSSPPASSAPNPAPASLSPSPPAASGSSLPPSSSRSSLFPPVSSGGRLASPRTTPAFNPNASDPAQLTRKTPAGPLTSSKSPNGQPAPNSSAASLLPKPTPPKTKPFFSPTASPASAPSPPSASSPTPAVTQPVTPPLYENPKDAGFERPAVAASGRVPLTIDPELRDAFLVDADEQFEVITSVQLQLRPGLEAEEPLKALRRALHSLKGGAGQVGLSELSAFIHALEDRVESIRGPLDDWDVLAINQGIAHLERGVSDLRQGFNPTPASPELWQQLKDPAGSHVRGAAAVGESKDAGFERPAVVASGRMPLTIDPELRDAFLVDADEQFEVITSVQLQLRPGLEAEEPLKALRRALHSLKGGAGQVGLSELSAFIHALEDRVESIRGPLDDWDVLAINQGIAHLERGVSDLRQGFNPTPASPELWDLLHGQPEKAAMTGGQAVVTAFSGQDQPCSTAGDSLTLVPHRGIGAMPASTAMPTPFPAPPVTPQPSSGSSVGATSPATTAADSVVRVSSARIDGMMDLVSELLTRRGRLPEYANQMNRLAEDVRKSRNRLMNDVDRLRDLITQARRVLRPNHPLIAQGSELIRRLSEQAEDLGVVAGNAHAAAEPLAEDGEALAKITGHLWSEMEEVRVEPIKPMFLRLHRDVIAAADKLNSSGDPANQRKVEVVLEGETTGVDRSLINPAYEALMHIVRNAVSHGIEPPDERVKRGKPEVGRVTISASSEANALVIRVADDGKGLDYAAIEAKAREKKLLVGPERPTHEQLNKILFTSGFSTKEKADQVSGKGVGMDVVAEKIRQLKGSVEMASLPGRGTLMTIRLPVRYVLEQSLVVWIDGQLFALPVSNIETTVMFDPKDQTSDGSLPVLYIRNQRTPLISARQALGLSSTPMPPSPKVLVVRTEQGTMLALMVDAIVGARELVFKPLPPLLSGHPLVAGTGLTTSGDLIFLLNPSGLARCRLTSTSWQTAIIRSAASVRESRSVLVVDDSLAVRKVAANHLRTLGYEVDEAADGFEALQKLRAKTYRLVLSDLEMPRMNGFQLLTEAGRLGTLQVTPVVVASTKSDPETQRKVIQLGARTFVAKPLDADKWRLIEPLLQGESGGQSNPPTADPPTATVPARSPQATPQPSDPVSLSGS
ncbi:CheA signal transduction histidine kinase [Isosphaera pallida ATCC 43644]|uniref:histidine kinase n=1 Tax=Isosphaera pallida (strain ATCC 43644 / DSM 9630 / IS1B) TaxID=575540 RepID=E8R1Z1_ISOPI|nr:response regulator [Isosphaera pallida]ADV62423.1 CheA signal transduction histidine kinase [Isosphaera pallida ATCC 43644]